MVRKGCLLVFSYLKWLAGDRAFKSRIESNVEAEHCISSDVVEQDLPSSFSILTDM